jgi:hypothetical protein
MNPIQVRDLQTSRSFVLLITINEIQLNLRSSIN